MFALRFLSFAALVAFADAQGECYSCDSGCYKCTARGPSTTQPGYDTVTIDATSCKGESISWMCCTGTGQAEDGLCGISGTCPTNEEGNSESKCNNVFWLNFDVPSTADTMYFQSHDGKASGGGDMKSQSLTCKRGTNVDPFGGDTKDDTTDDAGSCNSICDITIDLDSCPNTPPSTGGGGGDPHIKTWAGEWFDYSGECDMVLLHAPGFAQGLGLDVHIRTKARYDYSFISNAVLKIDDETFEVASYGDSLLNGVSGVDFPATIAGYPISSKYINADEHAFSVELGHGQVVRFRVFKDMVTVKFEGALESDFGGSAGLMGSYDARTVTTHNGTVMALENVDEIAAEWQVKTESIFASVRAPQFPQACRVPSSVQQGSFLRLGASAN